MGLGAGTNTRAELLSLWALMWLANRLQVEELQVLGDSLAVIDWVNGKTVIKNSTLLHWYQRTVHLKGTFTHINIQHIYRDHNGTADALSKEGIPLEEGIIWFIDKNSEQLEWETHNIYYT